MLIARRREPAAIAADRQTARLMHGQRGDALVGLNIPQFDHVERRQGHCKDLVVRSKRDPEVAVVATVYLRREMRYQFPGLGIPYARPVIADRREPLTIGSECH